MSFDITQLPLWSVLKDKATDRQRDTVRRLVEHSASLLDRVIETFPTYTLHNSTHAVNVVNRMADLLGAHICELTPLEAAMLILSAFWHDVGMVFSNGARSEITAELEFQQFIDGHPEAYVSLREAGSISVEIAEWYCRWRHADRVFVHLNAISDDRLRWGIVSIREHLGDLCRSHNSDTASLRTYQTLQTNFLEQADLLFCAVILRIADILDFDNSRSPEPVYALLGLSRKTSPRLTTSDVEWRKHLASDGFQFPTSRAVPYQLGFVAGPQEPAVEYDVREFLDVIEKEFHRCQALLSSCSTRWRDFILPATVSRENIKSNGYRFGQYRFTLDQRKVIELFMGENLYEDQFIFVRELVQNAIDTSRYRLYREHLAGNSGFRVEPIGITEWFDDSGHHWLRVDDCGMGMDETIIKEHLLRVGSSFYKTAQFAAEVLRAREKGADAFLPISRFGIGLLSCFISGDRVEISTLHRKVNGEISDPVRLSLNGLHGFYTLQTPHLQPSKMPSLDGFAGDYRQEVGTSIAVRLDPKKEKARFDVRSLLEQHVLGPLVPVTFMKKTIGGDFERLIETPWCEPTRIALSSDEMAPIEDFLRYKFSKPLELDIIPLDLTSASGTPEVKGQCVVAIVADDHVEWRRFQEFLAPLGRIKTNISYEDSLNIDVTFVTRSYRPHELSMISPQTRRGQQIPQEIRKAIHEITDRIKDAKPYQLWKPGHFFARERDSMVNAEATCSVPSARLSDALPLGVKYAKIILDATGGRIASHNGMTIPPPDSRSRRPCNDHVSVLISHSGRAARRTHWLDARDHRAIRLSAAGR
jgi:hypothetical protein